MCAVGTEWANAMGSGSGWNPSMESRDGESVRGAID